MSGDLISRKAVIDLIESCHVLEDAYCLVDYINELPTAYDVDKVVGQLEECKRIMESPVQQDCYGEECKVGDCIVCAFDKALDIVKEGGVNG